MPLDHSSPRSLTSQSDASHAPHLSQDAKNVQAFEEQYEGGGSLSQSGASHVVSSSQPFEDV